AAVFAARSVAVAEARARLARLTATPHALAQAGFKITQDGRPRNGLELLGYGGVTLDGLRALWPELASVAPAALEQVRIEGHYAGYLARQEADIAAYRRDEALVLPADLDYRRVGGLSTEIRDLLARHQPRSLGQAARISGVTPAALVALLRHVKAGKGGAAGQAVA
ncbi:MAG: tRNA uridine-5-carboxymethylaminomethyl(34) synthesis enzyme MnmG, partial [Thalassobaculaceae bacterium]